MGVHKKGRKATMFGTALMEGPACSNERGPQSAASMRPSGFSFCDCMGWLTSALDTLYKKYIPGRSFPEISSHAGKENKTQSFLSLT